MQPLPYRFGFWAAAAAAGAGIAYAVPQVLQVLGLLADPWDRILIFTPSLVLAPAFVLAMAAARAVTPPPRRVWSLAALSLAIIYAVLVSQVYIVQLGVVIPHDLAGAQGGRSVFACCAPGQPLTAVDLLGYTFMSLATLFLAPAVAADRGSRALVVALIANGALAPFLVAQLAWPELIAVGALWLVTFPISMVLLAAAFARPLRLARLSQVNGGAAEMGRLDRAGR